MIRVGVTGDGPLASAHVEALVSLGCEVVRGRVEDMLPKVDAVVIAAEPGERFHQTALALEHDLDVLLEQPVAPTVENAWMLERIATLRPSQPLIQVSQPDAFDPALGRLAALASERVLVALDVRRRGDAPIEGDVHTVLSLAGSPLVRFQAAGGPRHTVATLVFESGLIATLSAGALRTSPACRITAECPDASIVADLGSGVVDPIAAQAKSFLKTIRDRTRPSMTLRNAIACMDVASGIRECLAVQAAASGSGVL
jgi:predicted dehydrogenase